MRTGQVMNGQAMAIIAVSAVLSALAICSVVLRFLARRFKGVPCFIDDYLIVIALVVTLGVTVNNIVGVAVAGIGMDEIYRTEGEAAGFPLARLLKPQGQVMFALQILHTCAMPLIKASVLAFYVRLFTTRRFKAAAYGVATFVFLWWIAILFATIFQCDPISANWGTEPSQMGNCLSNINHMYETAAVTNLVSDVIILFLPFPVVAKLHLSTKQKLALSGVFLTGAVVVVAGIGRSVAYFKLRYNQDPNFSSQYYSLVIWTSVEPTLGVIGACLPTLRPLFSGISPESIMSSIRNALSLRSLRSAASQTTEENDKATLHNERTQADDNSSSASSSNGERGGIFGKWSDLSQKKFRNQSISPAVHNEGTSPDRKNYNIVVRRDLDQRADEKV